MDRIHDLAPGGTISFHALEEDEEESEECAVSGIKEKNICFK